MIEVQHQRRVDLSADRVWAEMRQFDRVLHWVPGGADSRITVTGSGVGMVRDIELTTMGFVQHRLESCNEAERTFSYSLTGGAPLGMRDYQVTASVSPEGAGHSRIRWVGTMTGDGSLDEVQIGQALEMALTNMTTGIIAVIKGIPADFIEQPGVDY